MSQATSFVTRVIPKEKPNQLKHRNLTDGMIRFFTGIGDSSKASLPGEIHLTSIQEIVYYDYLLCTNKVLAHRSNKKTTC